MTGREGLGTGDGMTGNSADADWRSADAAPAEPGAVEPLSQDAAWRDEPPLALDDAADRQPWLEAAPVTSEPEVSSAKLAMLGLLGLLVIAVIVGGLWHLQSGGRKGREELIAAAPGDYKVRPAASGAKVFEGEGSARYAASEGMAPNGRIDPARVAEDPAVNAAPATPAPTKAPVAAPMAPKADAAPAPTSTPAAGGFVQLGAFDSDATARETFGGLQKRFAYLAPLSPTVTTTTRDGRTFYRLRVATGSRDAAQGLCQRLKVAGESCILVD